MSGDKVTVRVRKLPHAGGLPLPHYATTGSAGLDLVAAVSDSETLAPGERRLIPTGLCVAIPHGYEGQVRPRSGTVLRRGLGIPNSPGTIDSDYRGEVCVIVVNWSSELQRISRGERIAQLVIAPIARAELIEVADLDETERGAGGFGHTGA